MNIPDDRDTLPPPPSMPTGPLTHEDLAAMFAENFARITETLAKSLERLEQQFAAAIVAQTELLERAMTLAFDRTAELHQEIPRIQAKIENLEARLKVIETKENAA